MRGGHTHGRGVAPEWLYLEPSILASELFAILHLAFCTCSYRAMKYLIHMTI